MTRQTTNTYNRFATIITIVFYWLIIIQFIMAFYYNFFVKHSQTLFAQNMFAFICFESILGGPRGFKDIYAIPIIICGLIILLSNIFNRKVSFDWKLKLFAFVIIGFELLRLFSQLLWGTAYAPNE